MNTMLVSYNLINQFNQNQRKQNAGEHVTCDCSNKTIVIYFDITNKSHTKERENHFYNSINYVLLKLNHLNYFLHKLLISHKKLI